MNLKKPAEPGEYFHVGPQQLKHYTSQSSCQDQMMD